MCMKYQEQILLICANCYLTAHILSYNLVHVIMYPNESMVNEHNKSVLNEHNEFVLNEHNNMCWMMWHTTSYFALMNNI